MFAFVSVSLPSFTHCAPLRTFHPISRENANRTVSNHVEIQEQYASLDG